MSSDGLQDSPSVGPEEVAELQGGGDLKREIFQRYFDHARSYARQLIEDLSARVGASDVAAMAMKSALSEVRHGRFEYRGAGSFRALLFHILEHKIDDQVAKQHAKKRDVRRDRSLMDGKDAGGRGTQLSPEQEAEIRELVDTILASFLQNPHPVKRLVRILAFFGELEPIRIHRAVAENYASLIQDVPNLAETQPPGLRTVELEVHSMKLELKERYSFDPD